MKKVTTIVIASPEQSEGRSNLLGARRLLRPSLWSLLAMTCFWLFLFTGQLHAEAEPHKRYISLAPSTTEILFALGLDEEIVAVSSYCDYPAAALSRERMGDFSRPDTEKILFLKPDYVFCTGLEKT